MGDGKVVIAAVAIVGAAIGLAYYFTRVQPYSWQRAAQESDPRKKQRTVPYSWQENDDDDTERIVPYSWQRAAQQQPQSRGGWHNEEVVDVIRNSDGFVEKYVVHRQVGSGTA
jgi:hypothetical protein